MKKKIWSPLLAAGLALWLGVVEAKTELFFTSPSVMKSDGSPLSAGGLREMSVEPAEKAQLVSRAGYATGIAIDKRGNYYYGDVNRNGVTINLKKVNPRGQVTDLGTLVDTSAGAVTPGGWGFDLAVSDQDEIYFNHPSVRDRQGRLIPGYIAKLDLKNRKKTTVVPNLVDPSGLALDQLGNLYFGSLTYEPFKIQVYKLTTGGMLTNLGTAVDGSAGNVRVGGWGFDLALGGSNELFFNHPAVTNAQDQVLVAGHIAKFNLDTGAKTVVVTKLDYPSGLAADDAGNLYFGNLEYLSGRWKLFKLGANGNLRGVGTGLDAAGGNLPYGGWALDLAVNYCKDSDGDALCDDWEEFGYDADGDGVIDVDLPAMGASKLHKDIFVEVDWMPGHKPKQAAIDKVVQVFRDAPVPNPDGVQGIHLHVDTGNLGGGNQVQFKENLVPLWREFDRIKANNFNPKRKRIFHYGMFIHAFDNDSASGSARGMPSSDFVVSFGYWPDPEGKFKQQAGVFMHELGHNLGLLHGGTDSDGYKPNFFSVMNYLYLMDWIMYDGKRTLLDYSTLDIAPLDESNLDETKGLVQLGGSRPLSKFGIEWFDNIGMHHVAVSATGPIDWDDDGKISPTPVKVDVNRSGKKSAISARINEWDHLVFDGGDVGFGNKVRAQKDAQRMEAQAANRQPELTFPMYQRMQAGRHPER